MKPNSIFISERADPQSALPECPITVPVAYRPGGESFYDFLDFEDYEKFYFGLDAALDRFIAAGEQDPVLNREGISVLRCFRLSAFFYLLHAEMIRRAFLGLARHYPDAQFHIEKRLGGGAVPHLSDVIPAACFEVGAQVQVHGNSGPGACPPAVATLKQKFWLKQIARISGAPKVLVYSDPYRAAVVMKRLGTQNTLYYSCYPEPKIFLRSILNGFSYFQSISAESGKTVGTSAVAEKCSAAARAVIDRSFTEIPQLRNVAYAFLDRCFRDELPGVLFQSARARALFRSQPSLRSVLLDEDLSPLKNALCQTAQRSGLKCYVECHGALGNKYGYLPLTADRMFVWGEAQKAKLVRWGASPDRLVVSGCSKYAAYASMDETAVRRRICRKHGLDSEGRVVSFYPFPSQDLLSPYNRFIAPRTEAVLTALAGTRCQVIIKLHPAERNLDAYKKWAERGRKGFRTVVLQKEDPMLLTKASDLLIAHESTIAVDGFAMGKPVVFYPLLPETAFSNNSVSEFAKFGVFHMSPDEKMLRELAAGAAGAARIGKDSRKSCLNEGRELPEEIICRELLTAGANRGGEKKP